MTEGAGKNFIDLTANIVSAYLSNNPTNGGTRTTTPWSRRTMQWRARRTRRKWAWASNGGEGSRAQLHWRSSISGGCGKRLARVRANAFHHGSQPVGALRRQMFAKSEFIENRKRIGAEDFPRSAAGIQG